MPIMRYQKAEIEKLKIRCTDTWDLYQEQRCKKWYYRGELEIAQKNMDIELKKREPLVRIGAAVRMRGMEQAKYALNAENGIVENEDEDESPKFGFPDRTIIDKGNDAAHDGDSDADAVLFRLGYYDVEDDDVGLFGEKYKQNRNVYFALYKLQPEMFHGYDNSHFVRILNCQSTVRALTPTNRNSSFENGREIILNHLGDIL